MSTQMTLATALIEIARYPKTINSRRKPKEKVEKAYEIAIQKLNLSQLQVEYVAIYFTFTSEYKQGFEDVCRYLKIEGNYRERQAHQELIDKRILEENKEIILGRTNRKDDEPEPKYYKVSLDYVTIILENESVTENRELPEIFRLCQEINMIGNKYNYKTLDIYGRYFYKRLNRYTHFKLIKQLDKEGFKISQVWLLMRVLSSCLAKNENSFSTNIFEELKDFGWHKKLLEKNKFLSSSDNELITKGYIEVKQKKQSTFYVARLGARSLGLLKEDGIEFNTKEKIKEGKDDSIKEEFFSVIHYDKIVEIPLFYNQQEEKEINRLTQCLEENKFKELQSRLAEQGMSKGICTIFYGLPGTGKTESVFQLAKRLKRDIVQVNIADCKSKWFGESQKNIKAIFDNYNKKCEKDGRIPILLLNEADALLSKRIDLDLYGNNTENAIQNIFLEELENFNGILVATTNLAQNLDNAFERRFLFKIKFNQPEKENAIKIWQNNIPFLTYAEAQTLEANYKFSGGQIRNIAKKVLIEEIISTKVGYDKIIEFCLQENFEHNIKASAIGFKI